MFPWPTVFHKWIQEETFLLASVLWPYQGPSGVHDLIMLPYVPRRDLTGIFQVIDFEREIILDYLGGPLEGRGSVRDLAKENAGKMRHKKDSLLLLALRQREVSSRTGVQSMWQPGRKQGPQFYNSMELQSANNLQEPGSRFSLQRREPGSQFQLGETCVGFPTHRTEFVFKAAKFVVIFYCSERKWTV